MRRDLSWAKTLTAWLVVGCSAAGDGSAAASSAGDGATDGGDSGGSPDEVDGMVRVPGGEFIRGCDPSAGPCNDDEEPLGTACVDEFWIGATEVTVGEYAACVAEGGCSPAETEFEYCTAGADDDLPITCVTWTQALSYCAWQDQILPTGEQWEKAARGTDGRRFPWGAATPTCALASMNEMCLDPLDPDLCPRESAGCGAGTYLPAGSKPEGASPYGALDMAGNASEWVDTIYDSSSDPELMTLRGGNHNGDGSTFDAWDVFGLQSLAWDFIGFRCATVPGPAECPPPQPEPEPPDDPDCVPQGASCNQTEECCSCADGRTRTCRESTAACGCIGTSDACRDCLDSCRGLPSCCTGTGCICDSAC